MVGGSGREGGGAGSWAVRTADGGDSWSESSPWTSAGGSTLDSSAPPASSGKEKAGASASFLSSAAGLSASPAEGGDGSAAVRLSETGATLGRVQPDTAETRPPRDRASNHAGGRRRIIGFPPQISLQMTTGPLTSAAGPR